MVHGKRSIIKLGEKNTSKDVHLVVAVPFCDLWKETIPNSIDLVIYDSREMFCGGDSFDNEQAFQRRFIGV